ALGEGDGPFGVDLVVGVDLDGDAARAAALGGHDPQVRTALVGDPLAVGTEAGPADPVVGMVRECFRFPLAVGAGAHDVGWGAEHFADVINRLAVGRPHGGAVLAIEVGEAAIAVA